MYTVFIVELKEIGQHNNSTAKSHFRLIRIELKFMLLWPIIFTGCILYSVYYIVYTLYSVYWIVYTV